MAQTNYDSEFCGKVPIHLTNLIQPYGVLVVVDTTQFNVIQVSENADKVFGHEPASILSNPLSSYIGASAFSEFRAKLGAGSNKIPAVWTIKDRQFLVLVHDKGQYLLIEIELDPISLAKRDSFIEVYQELKYAMLAIESTTNLQETCRHAAIELKRISGFDKVMIYKFDSDWNGFVMAEEREADMESYFGFTFPASDIPKQARDLYLKNPYRLIPDKDYTPVKLHPVVNPITRSLLDLSDCNLRSVVSVHLEYLANMGVSASMSTRILHEEKLWGLIACHHKTPKFLSYEMCSMFEMLSTIISGRLSSIHNQKALARENEIRIAYNQLIENIYKSNNLDDVLISDKGITTVLNGSGVVITRNGRTKSSGITPDVAQLEELILWLHTRQLRKLFYTDALSQLHDYADEYRDVASGLLVIPINYHTDSYVLLFRAETLRSISWGGNPDERIQFDKDEKNYHPRNSFKQWQQKVSGVATPWTKEEISTAEALRSFILEFETYQFPNTQT